MSKSVKVLGKRVKTTAKVSKPIKKVKLNFKSHEEILKEKYPPPLDLKLPAEFVEYHRPDFIKGVRFILNKDPTLYSVIVSDNFSKFKNEFKADEGQGIQKNSSIDQRYFEELCRSIIAQQVSGPSAKSIEFKVRKLFYANVNEVDDDELKKLNDLKFPSPEQILSVTNEKLRNAGVSIRKCEYIKELAKAFQSKAICNEALQKLTDEEIIEELVKVKGIGPWTAKMFLTFSLYKLDIFASDDLGVARGMSRYLSSRPEYYKLIKSQVDLSVHKKKSLFNDKKKRDWEVIHDLYVEFIAKEFAPYRTIFMILLWRISSIDLEIFES